MPFRQFKIAVLISGGGTTLKNLVEKKMLGELDVNIRTVISSNQDAGGLAFAMLAGIEHSIYRYQEFETPEALSDKIFTHCRNAGINLVVMGGFLRKLVIPEDFQNRVVNIHPSLIPAFCGKGMYGNNVHEAVLAKGSTLTGCTVHFVDNEYDNGPIIAQQSVRVDAEDTAETLAARVFEAECELYPRIISSIARGEVEVVGDEVVVKAAE